MIFRETLELSKFLTLNSFDLKILLDHTKNLKTFKSTILSQYEKNELESSVFDLMDNFFQYYLINIETFPLEEVSNSNLKYFLE